MARTESFQQSEADAASGAESPEAIISKALGESVTQMEKIGGSHNSQVFKVTCEDSTTYAAKLYFHYPLDDRRRLDAEYSGLRFMWENGLGCVPKPIVADRENGCGVYEYIEAEKIPSDQAGEFEVDAAVDFLVKLKGLRNGANGANLPLAAEAYFSVQDIVDNIQTRFDRLLSANQGASGEGDLRRFLTGGLAPTFKDVICWCREKIDSSGLDFNAEIPRGSRTLSPSDFGFHNALRRNNSEIVFLDFEYFGWDDPAKMISDFLLHPASQLDDELKHRFARNIIAGFEDNPNLASRVEAVYPLFGLKWCLIILNEFLPEDMLRRGFVGEPRGEAADVRADCLERASLMLTRISEEYQRFSYFD